MCRATVVIADRHPVVLHGLANVLGSEPDFEIIASCGDAANCIAAILEFAPDIAIIDAAMTELVELLNESLDRLENPSTRLVFFAASENYDLISSGLPARHSVLLREMTGQALLQCLREVLHGATVVPGAPTDQVALREQSASAENAFPVLTERERQIIRLVSRGLSNKEIGRRLNIADGTIKVHLHQIFQKLEVGNRTALAALRISQDGGPNPMQDKTYRSATNR